MSKTLRILGIRGIPAAHGGFETFAEQLALHLVSRGWTVIVYCQEFGNGTVSHSEWRGVSRVTIPVPYRGSLGSVLFDFKSIWHASRSKELCLTLGYNTAIFCAMLRSRGITNVINMDGIEWKRRKWGVFAKCWFYLNECIGSLLGTYLIADHPEIAKHLRRLPFAVKKITMIPYGGEQVSLADDALVRGLGLEPQRYLTIIARPEPENSILEMVAAFSRKRRGMKLAVLGEYDDRNGYCRAVRQAASPDVMFLGAIYQSDVVAALRHHCTIYLHGHQVGGTNPSLVEALGAGNAVIAHDNKFNRWVAGPTARFFRSADECSAELDALLASPEELAASRSGCIARFEASFTWPTVLFRYESLLSRCLTPPVNVAEPPSSERGEALNGLRHKRHGTDAAAAMLSSSDSEVASVTRTKVRKTDFAHTDETR